MTSTPGERLDLAKNARVRGDVYYQTMEMAGGAEINGKLVRTDDVRQRYLEHEGGSADEPGREPPGEPSLDIEPDVAPDPSAAPDRES
ncbi:MAG: polymer-forming cytoskeletal protein [Halofilum sp. (in: g-proteobacteria)]|nr:polymer-forming cytoskeletal protein [Halofilum sp. (in: g-proteobacteria)]